MHKFISAFRGYLRQGNFPLDATSVFDSVDDASNYVASNPTVYAGQILSVVNRDDQTVQTFQVGFRDGTTELELQHITVNIPSDAVQLLEELKKFLTIVDEEITITAPTTFTEPVSAPSPVSGDHLVTRDYLEGTLGDSIYGTTRSFKYEFTHTGLTIDFSVLEKTRIKRMTVIIQEVFDKPIAISVGSNPIFLTDDIFEDKVGTYIAEEPHLPVGSEQISIHIENGTQGKGVLYIDVNVDYINDRNI
jgi:hypothetical protein